MHVSAETEEACLAAHACGIGGRVGLALVKLGSLMARGSRIKASIHSIRGEEPQTNPTGPRDDQGRGLSMGVLGCPSPVSQVAKSTRPRDIATGQQRHRHRHQRYRHRPRWELPATPQPSALIDSIARHPSSCSIATAVVSSEGAACPAPVVAGITSVDRVARPAQRR